MLHSRDFESNPDLVAEPSQPVLLDSQLPAAGPDVPIVRYKLARGRHSFCLVGKDPYYTGMIVKDEHGNVIFISTHAERCRAAELAGGIYTVHVCHSRDLPNPRQPTLVGVDEPSAPLHDANGNPLGGYWAIAILNGDSTSAGVLSPQTPPRNLGDIYTNDMPIVAAGGSRWNETSLFSFPPTGPPIPLGPPGFFLDMTAPVAQIPPYMLVSGNHDCNLRPDLCNFFGQTTSGGFGFYHRKLTINDLGNSQFTFGWPAASASLTFSTQPTSFSPTTIQGIISTNKPAPTQMWLKFRYYPDGTQAGPLNQGEVEFFEKCNYQGKGVVVTNDFDPTSYSIDNDSIYHQFLSVRLSNDTTVEFSTIDAPGGNPSQSSFVTNDTACFPNPLFDANLVYALDKLLLNGRGDTQLSCPNCRLTKTNLSGFNLQGSNWQQADMTGATLTDVKFSAGTNLSGAKFINATLSNVSFAGANLSGADFTGAKLTCVDLSGTSQAIRDLSQIIWTNAQWLESTSCLSNFSYTKLSTKLLPPVLWKGADLTGAVFTDLSPGMQLSTQAKPLDLTGARLSHVNFNEAALDYAIMPSAILTGAGLRHVSLTHANLSAAKLFGADLNNANLDGSNLSGAFLNAAPGGSAASLVGSFLRNVNLSNAQLSGANFTNASFFGSTAIAPCPITAGFTQNCASAAGATLNNTIFSQAFLFGVDFSNTTIQGVQFSNAVVIGADFTGASLTGDTQVGTDSGFPGAFLQGTNLQPAKLLLNISLLNAYLDFSSQGNAFVTRLTGNHTVFPGWKSPGQPICVQMSYNNGTTVPTNNATMICPDGSQSSTGCGAAEAQNTAWQSQVDISAIGSYQFDATYTPAAQQPFCQLDATWFIGGLGNAKK